MIPNILSKEKSGKVISVNRKLVNALFSFILVYAKAYVCYERLDNLFRCFWIPLKFKTSHLHAGKPVLYVLPIVSPNLECYFCFQVKLKWVMCKLNIIICKKFLLLFTTLSWLILMRNFLFKVKSIRSTRLNFYNFYEGYLSYC